MDTNRLKRFATEARNILMQGVAHRLSALGFLPDGRVTEEPQQQGGGATFMGDTVTQDFYDKWQSLRRTVTERGIIEVAEEAAYTWFNRLVAIRILVKNGLASPVLEYESEDVLVPLLVSEARQGRMPEMDADSLRKLTELLDDDSKTSEQFALLIVAYCHTNPVINSCFGRISDYTELLLPTNILTEGGFVYLLNHTQFISEDDYRSPELIGWLYQFYISERKDEVFAKKGKFEADEIPAATQIFTPNWIVKYMVQNTVGRIYLDNNPYEEDIKQNWKYLVEPAEKPSADSILKYDELTDLRVADLACGSGHILNECFDLLYDLYIAEGYGRGKAIENIFRHNLTGIDLDTRAKQLATFALLLKACQKDAAFADGHCLPNVLDMTGVVPTMNEEALSEACLRFIGGYEDVVGEMLEQDFELLRDADNLGSIMKFNADEDYLAMLRYHYDDWTEGGIDDCPEEIQALLPGVRVILTLTEKYHALVMNPPYMGSGNMNATLAKYVKEEYEEGKADLMTVFMVVAEDHIEKNGKIGMITLPSWLFLSTFEKLRKNIVVNYHIDSLLHMGRGIFGIDWGSTAFIISNCECNASGTYFRLHKRNFQHIYYYHIEQLFLKALSNHEFKYDFDSYRDDDVVSNDITFESSEKGLQLCYPNVSQQDFEKIPGSPIGYWVSENMKNVFSNIPLGDNYTIIAGLCTGDNTHYIFNWHEVNSNHTLFPNMPFEDRLFKFHNKGGNSRKWYGNQDFVVKYSTSVFPILSRLPGFRNDGHDFFYKESISWAKITSTYNTFRYYPNGFVFDSAGSSIFSKEKASLTLLGFCNSIVARKIVSIINPTINASPGIIKKLPTPDDNNIVDVLVRQNISISKQDWDAHETSWDFEENPLLAVDTETYIDNIHHEIERHEKETGEHLSIDPSAPELDSLEWRMEQYKQKWEHLFIQLHANEEELNRQFINIYGLQDELPPDVPLDEITILQQGEIKITDQYELCDSDGSVFADSDGALLTTSGDLYLDWQDDVVMKQFISYAVGCMMGRYRLDRKGLHIAHPTPTAEETAPYIYDNVGFEIDEDGIIPLMPNDCDFPDNASNRFADFVRIAMGEAKHVENLNYVEKCLSKSVEQYFVKDFWKDHKKMYQNRPIYWLFSSKKGAFQCIAYMHRMNAFTAERIRTKYLLPHIEWLLQKQSEMEENAANLSTAERRKLDSIRKQIAECREYHDRLHVVADEQIAFDLDDGVVVNYAKFGDVLSKLK